MNDLSAFEPLLDELVAHMATQLSYVRNHPERTKTGLREALRDAIADGIPVCDMLQRLQELVQTYHEK